jgi:hypothetical protein
VVDEVLAKLSPAELEVDKAEECSMLLKTEGNATEEIVLQADAAAAGSARHTQDQPCSYAKAASAVLTAAASKLHSPRLATLATQVRLDAFTSVKKAVNDMVTQLLAEKADEVKHKDFCVDKFNKNQLETETKESEEQDLSAKTEDLDTTIAELAKAINGSKAEIAEMQVQMKRAGEDREKQNKEFQVTILGQRETQKLLRSALSIFGKFYNKAAALVQRGRQEPAGPPPPPSLACFETYKKSASSGGVMSMLEQILSNAKAMEAEAIRAEKDKRVHRCQKQGHREHRLRRLCQKDKRVHRCQKQGHREVCCARKEGGRYVRWCSWRC